MRVLFFSFYNKVEVEVHPGVGILSAALKKAGHQVRLQPYFYFDKTTFKNTIAEYNPDIIGLSATHMAVEQVTKLAGFLKQVTDAPIVLGGVFPILDSATAIQIEGIDAICIGEGIQGMLEFVEGINPATNFVYKNTPKFKFQNWSDKPLPCPDYQLFWENSPNLKPAKLDYWTSHTCEYHCLFCCNSNFRKQVGLHNKPRQSITCTIKNLKELIGLSGATKVQFRDPLFAGKGDGEWVKEFLPRYGTEIGLPFAINIRADILDEESAKLLADAGCYLVRIGLETGSEELRNRVLHKGESDKHFYSACRNAHKAGMKVSLNAMLGLPYETKITAEKTIQLLKALEPDKVFLHIFQPWTGLSLPKELLPFIKYLTLPAVNETVISGRTFENHETDSASHFDSEEYIRVPVLDQPSFPYQEAYAIQQSFLERYLKNENFITPSGLQRVQNI